MKVLKYFVIFFITSVILGLSNFVFSQDAKSVYDKASKSCVTIQSDKGIGSGFFIAKNLVVTNFHVISDINNENKAADESSLKVFLNSSIDPKIVLQYIAVDKKHDLVILQLDYNNGIPLTYAVTDASMGDHIFVIGSPKGLQSTISDGLISGQRMVDEMEFLQISAPISHGSSGGPLLNYNAEIVGIAKASIENGQNLNFAIPLHYLKDLYEIKKTNENNSNITKPKYPSEQSILYLNGKERIIKTYDVKGDYLVYNRPTDGPGVRHKVFLERLYSVRDSVLGERIIYSPDSLDSLELTKTEMRTFIDGEQYAMKHYRKPGNSVGATVAGVGGGLLSFWGLLTPFAYAGISGAFNPRVPLNLPDAPPNVNDDIFKDGYQYKARKVKAKNALIFGGIGVGIGAGILYGIIK